MPTTLHNPASLFNGEGQQHPPFTQCWLTVEAQHKTPLYKSTRCPMIGMAFISDLMQRYSPRTVMRATQTMLTIHHQNVCGTWPLNSQHPRKWPRWTVAAKSRHCFVRPTTSHMTNALQHAKVFLTGLHILTHHQPNDECTATQNTHLTVFYWPTKDTTHALQRKTHLTELHILTHHQPHDWCAATQKHIWLDYTPVLHPCLALPLHTLQNTSDWIIPLDYTPALPCLAHLAKHIWLDYTPGLYPCLALPLHTSQNTSNWIISLPCLALHTLWNIPDWILPLHYTAALPCHTHWHHQDHNGHIKMLLCTAQ